MTQCGTPVGGANLRAVRLRFRLDSRSRNPAIPVGAGPVFRAIGGIAIPEISVFGKGLRFRCDRIVTSEIIPKPNARDASTSASDHLQRLIEQRSRTGFGGMRLRAALADLPLGGLSHPTHRQRSDHRRRRGPDRHLCRGLLRRPQLGRAGDDRRRLPVGLHPGPWHRPARSHLRDPARHAGLPRGLDARTCRAPVASAVGTQALWEVYPPHLRRWINKRGGLSSKTIFLRGRELASMSSACR